jgi:glycosyltransferase involved in cell wall biosynthesis
VPGEVGPVAEELKQAGITVHALAAGSVWDVPVVGRFVSLVRRGTYDTVLSFLIHANTVAAIGSRFASFRLIQSIQTAQPWPRWHWWLQRRMQSRAQKIIVPSPSAARVAQEWGGCDPGKVVVIPNAIDPENFSASTVATEEPGPERYPIGFIGRLDPVKRVPYLVRSLLDMKSPVHLHIFGEGRDRAEIEATIAKHGLSERVTMHGAIARPQEALVKIGLLVLPSIAEGFGLVLIEAMASRVPVIGTDVPGIRDVIRHGENGLLVSNDDELTLAGAIDKAVGDLKLRRQLIDRAIEDVLERFTWERIMPMYRRLLELD